MTNHTTLHINCTAEQKAAWMLSARINNMSFEDWVRVRLDSAVIDANPVWLDGLSERSRICLLSAGFDSCEAVKQAIDTGFDIAGISNAGNKVKAEVIGWLK